MSALDSIAENHPSATGFTGTVATGLAWFLSYVETINAVLRCLSLVLSVAIAILTFAILLRKYRRDRVEADRERFYIARQRDRVEDDDDLS